MFSFTQRFKFEGLANSDLVLSVQQDKQPESLNEDYELKEKLSGLKNFFDSFCELVQEGSENEEEDNIFNRWAWILTGSVVTLQIASVYQNLKMPKNIGERLLTQNYYAESS